MKKTKFSEWASPIVPVVKSDGTLCICGDYKATVNKAAKLEAYPLPKVDDLLSTLAGGNQFSKLDLSHAYLQVEVEESSQKYTTINTHKGLYMYKHLPFGINSPATIFQRLMENLLLGIPQVCVYLDDILTTGRTQSEHLSNLEQVLRKLAKAGMRLKRGKCKFLEPQVEYLGHKISQQGIQPTKKKVEAIVKSPRPSNVPQLRSFLGLVNFYGKFISNLATILCPLYNLLNKGKQWSWKAEQERVFSQAKKLLQ